MSDAPAPAPHHYETTDFDAAALAKLRAFSRPGFEPKTLIKSVSPFEVVSLVLLVLVVVGIFVVYSFFILPDQVRYVQLSNEVAANQTKITELQQQIVDPHALTAQFQEVRDSLDAFRGSVLKPRLTGRLEIIDAINRTTTETGVQLASAVEFRTQGTAAQEATDTKKRKRKGSDSQAEHTIVSYPSLGVAFSIAGSYQQLRSFISRLEASGQFVVIDGIKLDTSDASRVTVRGRGRRDVAPEPSGLVTLEIKMTAYFQPEASVRYAPVAALQ